MRSDSGYDSQLDDIVPVENRITEAVIDNLAKPIFVTIQDDSISEYIYSYCKHLLKYSMERHESKEVAYAINLNTLDFVGAVFGTSRTVDIEELISKMDGSEYIFIVLHNHPSNSTFSPKDLNTFFEAINISVLVVIGNSGAIHVIEKTKPVSEENYLLIKKILINYRKALCDFDEAISGLQEFGVIYSSF
ncbi:hypothetical protein SAMN04487770_12219 [Butyrivibrio sp. ob235]|nr:hypothetical protein SAMN04487770_12219 [Butyrivibrio sp. ob235]